jgi:ABC-2 type transport system permease protein
LPGERPPPDGAGGIEVIWDKRFGGALFPVDQLPRALKVVVYFDPVSYGVDAVRGALVGISHFGFPVDLAVLAAVTFVALVAGSLLFEHLEA